MSKRLANTKSVHGEKSNDTLKEALRQWVELCLLHIAHNHQQQFPVAEERKEGESPMSK